MMVVVMVGVVVGVGVGVVVAVVIMARKVFSREDAKARRRGNFSHKRTRKKHKRF
jgi:MFS superfamily sulfate permease-like transporter